MTTKPIDMVLQKLNGTKKIRGGWRAECPAHISTNKQSLCVKEGDDQPVIMYCHAGCELDAILSAMGLAKDDIYPNGNKNKAIAAAYDYTDESGALLYQSVRFVPKDFRQRRPDGAGGWHWNMQGVRKVLYRLPEVVAADPDEWVFVVEGEKATDALVNVGLAATTAAMGAGKWHVGGKNYTDPLQGRKVAVLPDNDGAGRKHADDVARSLDGTASTVRVVELPNLADAEDVVDWLFAGGDAQKLIDLADKAADYESSSAQQQQKPQRGRPRKYKLVTDDYITLYQKWGYNVRLNLCQDDVEVNGAYLDDIQLDHIFSKVRDYGTNTDSSVNVQHAKEALSVLAARHSYHPIRDYLESLTWDGKDNILTLASHLIGVDQRAKSYIAPWLNHWCIAAVAKVYEGYQSPMLVLDAPQDAGKDYLARWLCPLPEYFIESPIAPDNKDHRLRLIQTFVWDVAELGGTTRRADVEALKAFITLNKVRERKPWGKREIIKPALASFIGTVNNDAGFLVDRTGNRRFLVCALKEIDWSYATTLDVHQVWAQAVHVYKSGDDSWKLDKTLKDKRDEINTGYMVDDPVEAQLEALYKFTGNLADEVALPEIMADLGYSGLKPSRSVNMSISSVMRNWGATKKRRMNEGQRERFYAGVARRD